VFIMHMRLTTGQSTDGEEQDREHVNELHSG
jgi:hypothetical protein